MILTSHFTLEELIRSDVAIRRGIDNRPDAEVVENLKNLARGLERVRAVLRSPIIISSAYRCPKLNSAVGGATNSAHLLGNACDFTAPAFGTPREVASAIVANTDEIAFDQLILEGEAWVHISFGDALRGEVMTAIFHGGKPIYSRGLA